jgi:hypothetical protein
MKQYLPLEIWQLLQICLKGILKKQLLKNRNIFIDKSTCIVGLFFLFIFVCTRLNGKNKFDYFSIKIYNIFLIQNICIQNVCIRNILNLYLMGKYLKKRERKYG